MKCSAPSVAASVAGRSPCGERGLKSDGVVIVGGHPASLPVRGAWVEIFRGYTAPPGIVSLPVRGAWVEITSIRSPPSPSRCRSPCGERGLK